MMQVTDHLQENAALEKASAYLEMMERESENDVSKPDDTTDLVGKPYDLIVIENGNHKFVLHRRSHANVEIHPFLVNWIMEQLGNNDSPLHQSTCIELFYEYKRRGILYCSHPD